MCGILAAVSKQGGIRSEDMARATRTLRHRGPDAQHVWTSPDGRAGLGHARLSIIDLETGDQPIANEDGRLRLVANGELYDFERIREALCREGHRFRTRSDSEIALHLYEDRGTRALHALRGEFALAIWDARDGQLFAARDRFGIKPLYYTIHNGTFYLASEIKALAEMGVPLRWDRDTLYDMHFVSHPPDRTLFAGIFQLPPASFLITDGEHVRIQPYWDWNYPLSPDAPHADGPHANGHSTRYGLSHDEEREWVARIGHAFEEAVRLRLRADVPVACYLSGGIDSCAVLGTASRLSSRPLRAYTLSFDHADYDEGILARDQAQLSGAEFCRIDIRADHLADNFSDAIYYAERPFANAHSIAKYLLSRAVRDSGIKVVMTGEGSDEIFAGYPHFRRDLVLYGNGSDPATKARLLAELEAANRVSAGLLMPRGGTAMESVQKVLGFVPSGLETWAQLGAGLLDMTSDEFQQTYADRDTFRVMLGCLDVERQLTGRHAVNQSLYIWGKTMLPNYILSNLGDRMEMAHSVEGRLPFLDHHVVEEAARMPVSLKIKGMTEKYVLREAARPVLTPAVYARQKHPFMSPPATIQTEGKLYAFLQDTLRGSVLDRPGIYDRKKVVGLLDRIPTMDAADRTRTDLPLMWMTSLCLLADRLSL
jgi:asparagine synthase (glutamine-hydrolysing)